MAFYQSTATIQDWTRSEKFHNSFLLPKDDVLDSVTKHSKDSGLPDIAVSEAQGKFLNLLARSIGAKRILEIGTLGGFSTIHFARAVPADGNVTTLEFDPLHAKVASENFKRAGVENKITLHVGRAADSLVTLHPEKKFDLVFIDADKSSNVTYFTEAKRLIRSGGVIIVDNAVYEGKVADPEVKDSWAIGTRDLLSFLKDDKEVEATTIGTAGVRGFDGFIYAIRK
ncbi:hypothetical protein CVT25_015841 [Psilocybe cyanescens]|uniref:O-methyltransferase domain-containing protein n=1 Tax=Psilocybe cyanescens TaxID=93625 RepID=A0A409XSZ6_PSICY|nr:hypothetical protein CVT25_015841 [Psilocybe cyanescens]